MQSSGSKLEELKIILAGIIEQQGTSAEVRAQACVRMLADYPAELMIRDLVHWLARWQQLYEDRLSPPEPFSGPQATANHHGWSP